MFHTQNRSSESDKGELMARSYEAMQEKRVQFASSLETVTVTGIALDILMENPLRRGGYHPINPCVCVAEPCPCDGYEHERTVLWIPEIYAAAGQDTGRRTTDGEVLQEYKLPASAIVLVESVVIAAAGSWQSVAGAV